MSAPSEPAVSYEQHIADARALLFQTADYLSEEEKARVDEALAYAREAHEGQNRKSGEPYILHPIAVATELAKWHMDAQTLSVGLMHDVLEDTGITKPEMAARFGDATAEMVDGLSKLEKLKFTDQVQHQAESFRKLILAMTRDIRVIIIKLSDRLHNMRTMDAMKPERRLAISRETLEIYAPIANRIGFNPVYRELQDLAFRYIRPGRYRTLQKAMHSFRRNRRDIVGKVLAAFSQRLVGANIEAQIKGREKNLYSIHQKMRSKGLRFEEITDIYGFRVITNSIPDCYAALGALHGLYQPKPGKFKDYIAIPKSNGYQSLHTTLNGPHGLPIEVQIRTREMNAVAESGVASHWAYKSGDGKIDHATQNANKWLQNILDLQARSANAVEFLEHVKIDLFPSEVYTFTPKGRIIVLPEGATPIDFAYAVHTDIGNHTVAARVDNHLVPLRTRLRTGNTVEIITDEQARPNAAWLGFTVSGRARSAIRNYLKNMDRREAVKLGETLLQKALSGLLPPNVLLSEELKEAYLDDLKEKKTSFEDVLYAVGMGHTLPVTVAMHIAELAGEHLGGEVKLGPIKISGNEGGRIRLGPCCNPIPGDSVRALLIKDQGIVIHRENCPNLLKSDPNQQLDADWEHIANRSYHAVLLVSSQDKHGLLAEMAMAMSEQGADIEAVDTPSQNRSGTEGFIEFKFTIKTADLDQLNRIVRALHDIPQVQRVTRI